MVILFEEIVVQNKDKIITEMIVLFILQNIDNDRICF